MRDCARLPADVRAQKPSSYKPFIRRLLAQRYLAIFIGGRVLQSLAKISVIAHKELMSQT
jgi:hypothetical protein